MDSWGSATGSEVVNCCGTSFSLEDWRELSNKAPAIIEAPPSRTARSDIFGYEGDALSVLVNRMKFFPKPSMNVCRIQSPLVI